MMFYYLQTYKFFLILIIVDFLYGEKKVNSFSLLNKNNKFEEIRSDLISKVEKYKLATYMKRNKIKNRSPLADSFVFLDSPTDILILKKIKSSDINFSSNELEKSFNNGVQNSNANTKISQKDDFNARIFSFIYKNIKTKSLQFTSIGVSLDEEKIPEWKVFLVLMDYIKDDSSIQIRTFSDNKLLKVCLPENDEKNVFAIVVNFDKSCLEYVNFANSVNLLSDEQYEKANKLRQYQNNILNKNLSNSLSTIKDSPQATNAFRTPGSFIEKSQNIIDNPKENYVRTQEELSKNKNDNESGKAVAIDSLVSKFSVEELNKIKSLIKFAKKNKIMDDVYTRKGEINLNDLAAIKNPNFNIIPNNLPNESKDLISISNQISYLNNFAAHIDSKMTELTDMISSVKEISLDIKQNLSQIKEDKKDNKTKKTEASNEKFDHKSLRFKQKFDLETTNNEEINKSNKVNNNDNDNNNNQIPIKTNLEINKLTGNSIPFSNNLANNININNNINSANNNQSPSIQQIPIASPQIPINNILPNSPIQTMSNNILNQIPINNQPQNLINSITNSQMLTQQPLNNIMTGQTISNNLPIHNNLNQPPNTLFQQNQMPIQNTPLNNPQFNTNPVPAIPNGVGLGGSFTSLLNNQAQTNVNNINNNIQVQNNNNQNKSSNNNQNNNSNHNAKSELDNLNKNNSQSGSEQKHPEIKKLNEKRINDSNKKPAPSQHMIKDHKQINQQKINNPKPATPAIKHDNKVNNSRQTPAPRIPAPIKKPNYVNKKQSPQVKRPDSKKSNSPFLSNSFENLEDDDVMEISANNNKALKKSKQIQKKNDSFDFDDDSDP